MRGGGRTGGGLSLPLGIEGAESLLAAAGEEVLDVVHLPAPHHCRGGGDGGGGARACIRGYAHVGLLVNLALGNYTDARELLFIP